MIAHKQHTKLQRAEEVNKVVRNLYRVTTLIAGIISGAAIGLLEVLTESCLFHKLDFQQEWR